MSTSTSTDWPTGLLGYGFGASYRRAPNKKPIPPWNPNPATETIDYEAEIKALDAAKKLHDEWDIILIVSEKASGKKTTYLVSSAALQLGAPNLMTSLVPVLPKALFPAIIPDIGTTRPQLGTAGVTPTATDTDLSSMLKGFGLSKPKPQVYRITVDSLKGMQIVLCSTQFRYEDIPKDATLEELESASAFCKKYQAQAAMGYWLTSWADTLQKTSKNREEWINIWINMGQMGNVAGPLIRLTLCASSLSECCTYFNCDVYPGNTTRPTSVDKFPQSIVEYITTTRLATIRAIIILLRDLVGHMASINSPYYVECGDQRCFSFAFGSLMHSLERNDLLPLLKDPQPQEWHASIDTLVQRIKMVKMEIGFTHFRPQRGVTDIHPISRAQEAARNNLSGSSFASVAAIATAPATISPMTEDPPPYSEAPPSPPTRPLTKYQQPSLIDHLLYREGDSAFAGCANPPLVEYPHLCFLRQWKNLSPEEIRLEGYQKNGVKAMKLRNGLIFHVELPAGECADGGGAPAAGVVTGSSHAAVVANTGVSSGRVETTLCTLPGRLKEMWKKIDDIVRAVDGVTSIT